MKVSNKQKLFSLSTFILSLVVLTLSVLPRYSFLSAISHSAIAAVGQQDIFGINNSVPTLPGNLALSNTQQQKILEINQILSQEIQAILTQEQIQKLALGVSRGLALLPALNKLTLAQEQKKQLQTAIYSALTQMHRVLTPRQLKYIRQQ